MKKRLKDRLIDFVAVNIIENEQTNEFEIIKLLVLSKKMFTLKKFKTAYQQLKNAEAKAIKIADFHSLNEIYQLYIQYSYLELSPPQSELYSAYKKNKLAYSNSINLNMVYASLRKAFQNQYSISPAELRKRDLHTSP